MKRSDHQHGSCKSLHNSRLHPNRQSVRDRHLLGLTFPLRRHFLLPGVSHLVSVQCTFTVYSVWRTVYHVPWLPPCLGTPDALCHNCRTCLQTCYVPINLFSLHHNLDMMVITSCPTSCYFLFAR